MKKTIFLIVLTVLTLSCLTACVNNDSAGGNSAATDKTVIVGLSPTAVPQETEEDTGEGLEITPLEPVTSVTVPEDSSAVSYEFAEQLLTLSSTTTAEGTKSYFETAGFTVLLQKNYDKTAEDASHTSGYTIGSAMLECGGTVRPVVLVAVRGTVAGEWYSNFDFAPSCDDDTCFAENFLYAAEDVYVGLAEVLKQFAGETAGATGTSDIPAQEAASPIIIVCGHSRGAAVANLLGVLLDEAYGTDSVYVYTFATPATVRGIMAEKDYPNIFNFINPCDIVPMVPLAAWGYSRAGQDITLSGDISRNLELEHDLESLLSLAPTVSRYYTDRHSITEKGLSEDGLSTYDVMLLMGRSLAGLDASLDLDVSAVTDLDGLAESTDFDTLISLLKDAAEDDNAGMKEILKQHLADRYLELIKECKGD